MTLDDLATRTGPRLDPNPRRVVAKLFVPGEETPHSRSRANAVLGRIMALDEAEVVTMARGILADYGTRHRDLPTTLAAHFDVAAHELVDTHLLTSERRTVIGACFTHEYTPEGAALTNPSMVAHPDQSGLAAGQLRFVMAVRCVGEGHISSIGFRSGILGPGPGLVVDEASPLLRVGTSHSGTMRLGPFFSKLADLGVDHENAQLLLSGLSETFTTDELQDALTNVHEHTLHRERVQRAVEIVHHIARASYDVDLPADSELSERLLWPTAPGESHGMEDARLVRFAEDDGTTIYYATYTAYDGTSVATSLIGTRDFLKFHIGPMAGRGARNKGLAIFPRRIGGRFFALSRWDRESLALVDSDDCRVWESPTPLHLPLHGWELIQIGNGGSPIETPDGWLVLTHGVGPMREYALGAMLLDLDDPARIIATLPTPLLTPNAEERDGYVPNVVYTCGALLHDGRLTIPYGISDGAIGFAQVELAALLDRMVPSAA